MTTDSTGQSRLSALAGSGPVRRPPDDLVSGARTRTAQAITIASRAYAGTHGPRTEPGEAWPDQPPGPTARWSVTWRAAVAATVVLVVLVAVVVLRSVSGAPEVLVSTADPAVAPTNGSTAGGHDATAAEAADLTVHVVGAVLAPGVVVIPAGSRAVDALHAAGGAAPDADLATVNLARPMVDGEQLVVPVLGQSAASGEQSGDQPIDVNRAEADVLEELPRIGPVLAERIVAWRTANGPFSSVDELGDVPGIGPALLAALDGLVRV